MYCKRVFLFPAVYLHSARVEHDANAGRGGRGWEVVAELGTDKAVGAVGTEDFPPDASELCFLTSFLLVSFVNECNSFSNVELCLTFVSNTLEFEEGCVFVLIS